MEPLITELTATDASIAINHFGAQVYSWKVGGVEQLFLSAWADHDTESPLRGGIPVCFPWFGGAAQPFHGFARNHLWDLVTTTAKSATFKFTFDSSNYPVSPGFLQAGTILLTCTLEDKSLTLQANITSHSNQPEQVELGFHSYFQSPIQNTILQGVNGRYDDYTSGQPVSVSTSTELKSIPVPIDRVYHCAPTVTLNHLQIKPQGFTHTVVWNPGENPGISDLPDRQATDFLCVEQLYRNPNQLLAPGETLNLTVTFTA